MNTETTTYLIPKAMMGSFEDRFEKIIARAEKLGVTAPTFQIVGEKVWSDPAFTARKIDCYEIIVDGDAPRFDGWAPIAVVQIDHENPDAPNVVHPLGDTATDPAWRTAEDGCDHCGTNRRRTRLVVVEHDNGDRKTVGATCLRDFLGHQSPEQIAAYVESLGLFAEYLAGFDEDEDIFDGASWPAEFDPAAFLAAVITEVDENGWVPRSGYGDPTADVVARAFMNGTADTTDPEVVAEARAAIEWARQIDPAGANDYLANVHAVASKNTWGERDLGLAASLAPLYRREMADAATDAAEATSEHFGAVKERITFTATITRLHRMSGYAYNSPDRAIVTMTTTDGNVAVWFASNAEKAPKIGDTVEMTGTVKDHDTYRDVAQTIITRCKFTPATEGATR